MQQESPSASCTCYFGSGNWLISVDDGEKIFRFQGGSSNQTTIDIGLAEKFFRIGRTAGTAIENGAVVGNGLVEFGGYQLADKGEHVLCLLRTGGPSRSNGPDRFIGNDDFLEVVGREVENSLFQLCFDECIFGACLTDGECLSAAIDGSSSLRKCKRYCRVENFTRVVVIFASFGVTKNHIGRTR